MLLSPANVASFTARIPQVLLFQNAAPFDASVRRHELLPGTLKEAVDTMEGSKLLHETLGEHLVEWFLRNKRAEWAAFAESVTPFELARYLPLL